MPPAPVIETVLARVLYEHPGEKRNATWLAEKLGVSRQMVGQWLRGRDAVPRSRQAQIRVHVEEPTLPLFDGRGRVLRLDGSVRQTREEIQRATRRTTR